ncbi:MAG: DNA gyrase inhibitor YacG [Solirubrobacterales bacterium]
MRDQNHKTNDHSATTDQFPCPICKRPVKATKDSSGARPRFFPFCSERCKLIDLGAWFDANYRIAGKPDEDSEESLGGDSPNSQ